MAEKILEIEGMHCASCALAIEMSLTDLEGIEKIDVDFSSNKATVEFDESKISLEKIVGEIKELGYRTIAKTK